MKGDSDEWGLDFYGIGKETLMKWVMDNGIGRETMMKRECIMGVKGGR